MGGRGASALKGAGGGGNIPTKYGMLTQSEYDKLNEGRGVFDPPVNGQYTWGERKILNEAVNNGDIKLSDYMKKRLDAEKGKSVRYAKERYSQNARKFYDPMTDVTRQITLGNFGLAQKILNKIEQDDKESREG